MAPSKQTTQQPTKQPPFADDLIFLLSIVGNPNSFIAKQQQQQTQQSSSSLRNSKPGGSSSSSASSWQQTLTSLPSQRRDLILALQKLANAYQKWNNLSAKRNVHKNEVIRIQNEADALHELEDAASAIRICSTEYLESVEGYKRSLQQFWYIRRTNQMMERYDDHNNSELAQVGHQLVTQLISQLQWDEKLVHAILTFLNEELYHHNNINKSSHSQEQDGGAAEKLRTWSDAMSKNIKIDKSYWNFVEREVFDETELEHQQDDNEEKIPEFLNGEISTQYLAIDSSNELEKNGQENNNATLSSENAGKDSLHERIVSSASLEEAINTFIHSEPCQTEKDTDSRLAPPQERSSSITSILLVGEEGCGKTHLLDSIQQKYHASDTKSSKSSSSIKILRPKYPVDLVGSSIGSTEDRLIALFTYASRIITTVSKSSGRGRNKCLIMLDDIDRMFALSNDISNESSDGVEVGMSPTQYYIGRRCKALFITILDALYEQHCWPTSDEQHQGGGHLLLVCTSRSSCGEVVDRFDRFFRWGQPDEKQRRQIIVSCLSFGIDDDDTAANGDDSIETILSLIVQHSAGRSAYELSQCCREAILSCAKSTTTNIARERKNSIVVFKQRLQYLDRMLQTKSPQSLRGGALDGVVDMRVYTPEELQFKLKTDANGKVQMPLLGADAKRAHEALMNVIITPLCRSDEIRALLYGGGSGNTSQGVVDSSRPIKVGCLLAGGPGVGKTSLAYHCASLAAKLSRVSLLDVSCTSLIHKEIGGSERAVQRLFAAVRAAAPCIVLLDGIDCVATKRGNDTTSEGTMDRVLSTFLTEMDGIEDNGGSSGNVAVIGITHNPNLIDPSLLRPGRLEKTITLGAPDFEARKELVVRQIKDIEFDFSSAGYFDAKSKEDVSSYIAMASAGMSAVEVIAICREASMECLRELNFEATEKPLLTYDHFKSALTIMKGKSGNSSCFQ